MLDLADDVERPVLGDRDRDLGIFQVLAAHRPDGAGQRKRNEATGIDLVVPTQRGLVIDSDPDLLARLQSWRLGGGNDLLLLAPMTSPGSSRRIYALDMLELSGVDQGRFACHAPRGAYGRSEFAPRFAHSVAAPLSQIPLSTSFLHLTGNISMISCLYEIYAIEHWL
jgi:hypothetical protein